MSIRLIAQDLYRVIREAEALERQLAAAPPEEREGVEQALRKARAERERMCNMLEGHKG